MPAAGSGAVQPPLRNQHCLPAVRRRPAATGCNNPAAAPFAAACSRTARRLFWYLLACAIGVVVVRWLQSIEGVGMMWVFLSAVSWTDTMPHPAPQGSTPSACRRVSAATCVCGGTVPAFCIPCPKLLLDDTVCMQGAA
jgi:hypothetical protein